MVFVKIQRFGKGRMYRQPKRAKKGKVDFLSTVLFCLRLLLLAAVGVCRRLHEAQFRS